MLAVEKLVVQIFERRKWIIDQAQRQCFLFDQRLSSKLIIDGIAPPPWLRNPEVDSLTSDPKEFHKDELISEVLFPQPQSAIPFSGHHCSLYSNLVVKTDDKQCRSGLHNEVHAWKTDGDVGDGLSNLPDCFVSNAGCASIGAPEMHSGAISPQNQIEVETSESYHEPALSLAKLQRSKSRQKALEQRNSAKAAKTCSDVDNNANVCANIVAGSVTSYLQSGHIEVSHLFRAFDTNIQRCAAEEVEKGVCQTQKNDSNYSGRVTRSKRLAQRLNCSGVDNSVNVCAGRITGSVTSSLQLKQIEASNSVKILDTNIQSCETEEMEKVVCQTQINDNSNYCGRITKSKSLAQNFSCLNVVSSPVVDEDGHQSNNVNEPLKPVKPPHFTNGSCRVKEASVGDNQRKEMGSSVCHNRLTRSRSSSQEKCENELMKFGFSLGSGRGVGDHGFLQPFAQFESTDLCKASDHVNQSKRKTANSSDCWNNKQENDIHVRLALCRSSERSSTDDFLMDDGSLNSLGKSTQLPYSLTSEHLYPPAVSVVGPLQSQKDLDFCAVKAREHLSWISSAEGNITTYSQSQNHTEEVLKSSCSNFCDKSSSCSRSAALDKSQNVQGSEMSAERSCSSQNDSKLDTEIVMDSAGNNFAVETAGRNTRVVTACTSFRHSASNQFSLGKSLYFETFGDDKVFDAQENVLSVAKVIDNKDKDGFAATVAKTNADFNGLVEKNLALGSTLGDISPKVGLDVSVSSPPSHFVMSVKPKQLDFDDVEESSVSGISSPELNQAEQGLPSEIGPVTLLETGNSVDEVTSLARQDMCNSSQEMHLLERQEIQIRDERPQLDNCVSHKKTADVARKTLNAMSLNEESSETQEELSIHTSTKSQKIPRASSINCLISSQVDCEKSSGSLPKDIMSSRIVSDNSNSENGKCSTKTWADALSATVTGYGLVGKADETVTNLIARFPSAAPVDELSVGLMHKGESLCFLSSQNDDLSSAKCLTDRKYSCFSTEVQIVKSSSDYFTSDVEHSFPLHKRRKIEIEANEILPALPSFLENPVESSSQRSINGGLNIKEDNREAVVEVQCLTSHRGENIEYQNVSNKPIPELQNPEECHPAEGSSPKMTIEESYEDPLLRLTEQGSRGFHNCWMEQMGMANSSGFGIDSTRSCTIDENLNTRHHQYNCRQASAEHLSAVERSASRRRVYPGGNARFSDGTTVSPGIQCLDLIGTDKTIPEFEGFIIQQEDAQPCTAGDRIELEKLNIPSIAVDYTSILEHLGKSSLKHSPLCNSSTPYRLNNIPDLYQSLPNGLLEVMGLRTSPLHNDENGRSLSGCLPNFKDQSTWDIKKPYVSAIQTLWDRTTLNFGSSGKQESLKPELPCISEENENVDEVADTLQKGIGSVAMTSSIRRELHAEITDSAKPRASVSQYGVLADKRGIESVNAEFSFSAADNKVKQNLEKQDGCRRRGMGKGKENQKISLGENRAKTKSVCNRPSRLKVSGKYILRKGGSTYSRVKSTCNNIVSNISSFIPLVQQKQAAAVVTGKRDIKVKALEAAEAAKRMAEKKENERNMKKETLKIERERLEQEKQENLRQTKLQMKRREEERKKKDAEIAIKRRQREEEEKKEKERKRRRIDHAKRKQQEPEQKICAKKEEKNIKCQAAGEAEHESKDFVDEGQKQKNLENNSKGNLKTRSEAEPLAIRDSRNEVKASFLEYSEAMNACDNDGKVIGNMIKATEDDDLIVKNTIQEPSYEISPYKGSDDEDEDEDNITNNKFIPSWASKHHLSLVLSSQKIVDPKTIFPPQSFCDIAEVLLPRKLQLK